MLYWTKGEYVKFSEEIMDKPVSFYAFEMLYWCGLRLGEMLAPTPADFNFEKGKGNGTNFEEKGKASEIIAKQIGVSSKTVEKLQNNLKLSKKMN